MGFPASSRLVTISVAAIIVAATGLSACSSSADSPSSSGAGSLSPAPSASGSSTGLVVTFKSTLTSSYNRLSDVGDQDDQTFGINVLDGTTTINDKFVRVRMLGTVDYKNKSGPFGGFLQLTWTDGTTLGMRQQGAATFDSGTKKTAFDAKLEVIGGNKAADGTSGTGALEGSRNGTIGSGVKIKVKLDLTNAPSMITGVAGSRSTRTPSQSYAATIEP